MKILRLLNRKYFSIILTLLLSINSYAEDKPIDIWNIEKETSIENTNNTSTTNQSISDVESQNNTSIYEMQSQKDSDVIKLEENTDYEKLKIVGLYDPEDYGLDISMWSNSNGDQLKNIFSRINKLKLSKDASFIMNKTLLINAYVPNKNISNKEYMKLKSDWLIKDSNYEIIEEYLIKNQAFNIHPELTNIW